MDGIRIILCLQTEPCPRTVSGIVLARLFGDTVACVELYAGQVCEYFHLPAALRILHFGEFPQCTVCAVDHEVMVIALAQFQLFKIGIDILSDRLLLCKIKGVPATGAISPVGIEPGTVGV